MSNKTFTAAAIVVAIGMFSPLTSALRAEPITWTIQNPLTFGLGGNLTGSFEYDAATGTYSNLQLQMTQDLVPAFGPADIIDPWEGFPGSSGPSSLLFGITGFGPVDVELEFANPLTGGGGTDTITLGLIADIREFLPGNGGLGDDTSSNTTTITAPTPEPGTIFLAVPGILLLIAEARRRKTAR